MMSQLSIAKREALMTRFLILIGTLGLAAASLAAQQPEPGKAVQPYIKVHAGRIVLEHVRVIDGTGKPAVDDRNVIIENGKIAAIQPGADVLPAVGQTVLDLRSDTVMPGLIGMHDHMYYIARPNLAADGSSEPPLIVPQMTFSSPRLYLAAGVTTLRTTGSVEPYTDLNLRDLIDRGELVGPHIDVTGPYLEGSGGAFMQMHPLKDADDARKTVAFWADQGATSFKAYMNITRDELAAARLLSPGRQQPSAPRGRGHLCPSPLNSVPWPPTLGSAHTATSKPPYPRTG